jgi:anthocyanidin 3-O-glucosyltransferase
VSFGTVASPRPDELRELAAGLEASGAPFLWSLREDSWPLLPPGFLDRATSTGSGLVVPWAPQVPVLRHPSVGAFVTHAGWASVLEGVSSRVPMACRPFFGDQRMNARSVAHVWVFGAGFEAGMTRAGVAVAVEELLRGEEGARMRAMHAPACVWEGVFYKCALNLRLNKYVWTAVNHFKSLWTQKDTLKVDGLN